MLNQRYSSNMPPRSRQGGVVLFIALIVLVMMTLAGISLMRSTYTGNLIAGNLAFQQSAVGSADRGVETAIAWLQAQTPTTLYTTRTVTGSAYSAVRGDPAATQSWEDYWTTVLAAGATPLVNTLAADGAGNTVSYVIHRLCNAQGDPSSGVGCDVSPLVAGSSTSSKGSGVVSLLQTSQVYYRITVRTVGPRNTVSFVQAVIAM